MGGGIGARNGTRVVSVVDAVDDEATVSMTVDVADDAAAEAVEDDAADDEPKDWTEEGEGTADNAADEESSMAPGLAAGIGREDGVTLFEEESDAKDLLMGKREHEIPPDAAEGGVEEMTCVKGLTSSWRLRLSLARRQ